MIWIANLLVAHPSVPARTVKELIAEFCGGMLPGHELYIPHAAGA